MSRRDSVPADSGARATVVIPQIAAGEPRASQGHPPGQPLCVAHTGVERGAPRGRPPTTDLTQTRRTAGRPVVARIESSVQRTETARRAIHCCIAYSTKVI